MEGNLDDDDENVKMMNMLMMTMMMIIIRMLTVSHQVVPIYPPLSSAKLEGLHEGAKLNQVHCQHHCGQHHYDYLHVHDQHRYCYQYHHDQHCLMILITRAT